MCAYMKVLNFSFTYNGFILLSLVFVCSDVSVAVWTIVVGVLARVHNVGHPSAWPAAKIIKETDIHYIF